MICSARSWASATTTPASSCCPPDAPAKPGDDARPVVGLDDVVRRAGDHPRPGVRDVACAASPGSWRTPSACRSATRAWRRRPAATAEPAYPVEVRDTVGCDRFAARVVRGVDPAAPTPGWMQRRLDRRRHPQHLAAGRHHQLRDARTRPADARLRRRPVCRAAGGAPGRGGGEADHPGRGRPGRSTAEDMVICDAGSTRGRRVSLAAAVMGGETSEVVAAAPPNVLFEAAHWDPVMVGPHRPPAQAVQRGGEALGAGRRPGRCRWSRWSGRSRCSPSTAAARPATEILDIDHVRAAYPGHAAGGPAGRRIGVAYPPARVVDLLEQVGCTVAPGRRPARRGPGRGRRGRRRRDALSVTPPTWRPDLTDPADLVEEVVRLDGYDRVPSRAAARAARPRPDPGSSAAAGRSPGRWPSAGTSRCSRYPFVVARSWPTSSACPPTTRAGRRCGWPTRCPRRSRCCAPRCSARCSAIAASATSAGASGTWPSTRSARSSTRVPAPARRRRWAWTGRPTDAEFAAADAVVPDQPRHVAVVLAGEIEPAGWWGAGRPAGWADAVEAGPGGARRRRHPGRPGRGPGRRARPLAPRPLRRAAGRRRGRRARR